MTKNLLPEYLEITSDIHASLKAQIDKIAPDKIAVLVDENTKEHCLSKLEYPSLQLIEIQSGEINKTLDTCSFIWKKLTDFGFSRKSLLINLGGGVIGDMGGFCAATFKRGISFINIPTTLLSQVDASSGGKLGIDFHSYKNHIGIFQTPNAVLIDQNFLATLPPRELKSGFAEVIKHALIFDKKHWEDLQNTSFDAINWSEIIRRSVEIKHEIVSQDPTEKGLRKILNFGHTIGHALESHYLETNEPLLHGEAVALGMILEAHLSLQNGKIESDEFSAIKNYLHHHFELPKKIPQLSEWGYRMSQDKKNTNGKISFSLLNKIGSCEYDVHTAQENIETATLEY